MTIFKNEHKNFQNIFLQSIYADIKQIDLIIRKQLSEMRSTLIQANSFFYKK